MRYETIDNQLFIQNRQRLKDKLKPNSLVILNSNDLFPRNGDQFHKFRQNSDLFWASGLDQENTTIILYPDCPIAAFKEIAFVTETNDQIATWEGHKFTKEEARKISGIKNIQWAQNLENVLNELMSYAGNVYLNANEYPKFSTEIPYKDVRFTQWIKQKYPNHDYERLAPIVMKLRLVKHPIEIELIKKACKITEETFNKTIAKVKPGKYEFEIQAEIDYEFTVKRCNGNAYDPIIASGENALCLHYTENNSQCQDGDLLLFDIGAEYGNYASDLSRTIPINGKFTERQKACYQSVLNVWKQAKTLFKIGKNINQINEQVNKLMEREMIKLGLFTDADVRKQNPEKPLYTKYFMHGTTHFLGLDVHDVGFKHTPLEENMILTCEPGIYIKEENIGIRIETDILITKNDPIDLMPNAVVEIDDIEIVMS